MVYRELIQYKILRVLFIHILYTYRSSDFSFFFFSSNIFFMSLGFTVSVVYSNLVSERMSEWLEVWNFMKVERFRVFSLLKSFEMFSLLCIYRSIESKIALTFQIRWVNIYFSSVCGDNSFFVNFFFRFRYVSHS